jgi:hypothetical protein
MHVMMNTKRLGAAIAIAGLAAAASSAALADHMDNCRTISDADAAKLQGRTAVVTDIDGVLGRYILLDYGPTNGCFLDQGVSYPRTDAALMMNIYHRRGYLIVYMAGRPRQMHVLGKSMCDATVDWLETNGFPTERGNTLVLLRDGAKSVVDAKDPGLAMAEWMGDKGTDLFVSMAGNMDDHFSITPAYGFVDSDVVADALLKIGVPADHIFTIGNKGVSRLGYRGTNAIVGPDANSGYTEHVSGFIVPGVEAVDGAAMN